MIRLSALVLLASTLPTFAQQPAERTLRLTDTELGQVWSALSERPFREVGDLMGKINGQLTAQALAREAERRKALEDEFKRSQTKPEEK